MERMLPWLHYPAPPSGSCWDQEEGEMWGLGKAVGKEGSSQLSLPPVLTTLCDLCWAALGGQACLLLLLEQERPKELHVPCLGLWPHSPRSLLLLHLSPQLCFPAGKPLKIIFYLPSQFRIFSESPLPPAK